MSTGNANLDLLIKLLSTATHPTTPDNIALIAMRKAGDQLAKFKTDWAGLLKGRVTVVQDPFAQAAGPQVNARPAPSASPPPPPKPAPRPSAPKYPSLQAIQLATASGESAANRGRPRGTNPHSRGGDPQLARAWFDGFDRQRMANVQRQQAKQSPAPDPAATTTQAAQPKRTNQFAGRCYTCSRDVPAGSGFLAGKGANGQYRVVCGDNFGHNAPYAQRSTRPQASADDIANLLDDTPF